MLIGVILIWKCDNRRWPLLRRFHVTLIHATKSLLEWMFLKCKYNEYLNHFRERYTFTTSANLIAHFQSLFWIHNHAWRFKDYIAIFAHLFSRQISVCNEATQQQYAVVYLLMVFVSFVAIHNNFYGGHKKTVHLYSVDDGLKYMVPRVDWQLSFDCKFQLYISRLKILHVAFVVE